MKIFNNTYCQILSKNYFLLLFLIFFSAKIFASEFKYEFEIKGNQNTDKEVILSLIESTSKTINDEYSNYILDQLNNSGLFSDISVKIEENKFIISVVEYPIIKQFFFRGNERFKDEDIDQIVTELDLSIYNDFNIKKFKNELKNSYSAFGYNNVKIDITKDINNQNLANVFVDIIENKITKIKSIKYRGNLNFSNSELDEIIKSKIKKLSNIFANNNFKPIQVDTDRQRLIRFYKDKGYADIKIYFDVEYYDNNSVIIYFNINEGESYNLNEINFINNTSNKNIDELLSNFFKTSNYDQTIYNSSTTDSIEKDIVDQLKVAGLQFFEITKLVRLKDAKADLMFEINSSNPVYINNINIVGNHRTLDYVIRQELEINEGDAFLSNEIIDVKRKVQSLGFFQNVNVEKKIVSDNLVDLEISIVENQTGTFTAGASFGSLDGVTLITGLNETNIGGTGRAVEFLINSSENNNEYTFNTTDRFFLNKDLDLKLGFSFKEFDYSKSSSYELDSLQLSSGVSYQFQENLFHSIIVKYELDDIFITDSSSVSSTIKDVEGTSMKFVLENGITYNTLNSLFFPRNGNYLRFENSIQTPSSSKNGYVKNIINFRKYKEISKDIFSFQAKIGNVFSLNNSDILPNDKFALGGKWLRGFDNFGVGPRNSRTSYVGGNNIFATKIDYSKLLFKNDDNPIYFNIFNDIGMLWENKTSTSYEDESIRSSAGFGLKFYSFIGPIAFTWGFPISEESYDIKRMFTFSVGNIN